MVVVADTSPLNYLVEVGEGDLLHKLYDTVVIPGEVFEELNHPGAPPAVRQWIKLRPPWLQIRSVVGCPALPNLSELDAGERAAIQLAAAETEALLVIDEAEGRKHADRLGLPTIGTLGVLRLAAVEGFVDLRVVLDHLARTNFRAAKALIHQLRVEDEERRRTLES